MTATQPSVAVLGTGIMGAPMARNLREAGHEVRAWNRSADKAEPLAEHGIEVAGSPAEAVRGVDAVVTMLADGDVVEEVMEGGGALAAMDDGALWIQTSTVGIAATERLAQRARDRGVDYVDAPVLGTRQPAEAGELVVIAAPRELADRCEAIFDAIGRETRWLDAVGAATRFKVVLNSWIVGLVESLAETIGLAEALDVEPSAFLSAIEGGPLDSGYAQMKGKAMVQESFDEVSFPLALAAKDAGLALEAARGAGLSLPLLQAARSQFERAVQQGHGGEDMAAAYWASRPASE